MTPVQMIAMQDQLVQIITLFLVMFGLVFEINELIKDEHDKYYIIGNMIWMIHCAVFYIVIFADRYTYANISPLFGSYTLWSSILRLHIIATIIILEFFRLHQKILRNEKDQLLKDLVIVKELECTKQLVSDNKVLLKEIHSILEKNERIGTNV